ncbi:cytochrome C [Flavobacteriaceae bacterium AU392]|nr:cytochrome C [Flavobacteriaceae bacterium]RKM83515.1 cytochrome C [Flavobacteriaceae bacterium AU392]
MKIIKKILVALLIVLIIMQFFGPDKNEGSLQDMTAFINDTNPPENVKTILENTCYDCHSSYTRYPWYNNITPVNYWMADHVRHGKGELDFSKWDAYSLKRKDHKLEEVIELVEEKEMPLPSYTWTHGDARLSKEQIESVIAWANQTRIKYSVAPQPQ